MVNHGKTLVYEIGTLGDTVITVPALKAVRRHFGPGAYIVLMHDKPQKGISGTPLDVLGGLGLIDEFMPYEMPNRSDLRLFSMIALALKIRSEQFQRVIYLAPSERSKVRVKRDHLFFRLCGIHELIGFHAFPDDLLYPVDEEGLPALVQHEAVLRLERIRMNGIDCSLESDLSKPFLALPMDAVKEAKEWLSCYRTKPGKPLIAICPGCKQPANSWPIDRFIEIGQRLVQQGKAEVLIVGGPAEHEIGEQMVKIWGAGLNAAGKFPVIVSAALLSQCKFMVGLDTGTTHLAAAQGIPCVAIYGSREEPGRFFPLGTGHTVLRNPVECAGCRLILEPCRVYGHPCMNGITVDAVWDAIERMQLSLGHAAPLEFVDSA